MKIIAITAIAALIGLMMSFSALAENGHSYNGSYCDAYFGNQVGDFNRPARGIRNTRLSGTRLVTCPVIVDEIANRQGTTRVRLHYTGGGRISCTMFSKNGNGTTRQVRTGTRVGTGWFNIQPFTSDAYWGSYSLYCRLPAGGILNTIWVGEKT